MGDLRDQLKKARLLSDKEARRLAHQERVERKAKGRAGLEAEDQRHRAELEKLRQAERERTRREQAAAAEERRRQEERAACLAILEHEARRPGPGSVRFYFELADGRLPCLELTPQESTQLRAGMLCVVRRGPPGVHDYRLLPTELARRVARVFPEVVVHAPRGVVGS